MKKIYHLHLWPKLFEYSKFFSPLTNLVLFFSGKSLLKESPFSLWNFNGATTLSPFKKRKVKSLSSSHGSCSLGQPSWDFQAPFSLSNLTKYSKSPKFSLLGKLVRVGISSFSPQGSWSLRITRLKNYPMPFFFPSISFMEEKKNLWNTLNSGPLGWKGGFWYHIYFFENIFIVW